MPTFPWPLQACLSMRAGPPTCLGMPEWELTCSTRSTPIPRAGQQQSRTSGRSFLDSAEEVPSRARRRTMSKVPLVVTDEAEALVAERGMQRELDQMLDWVRQNVPGLRGIQVAMSNHSFFRTVLPRVF